LVRTEAEPSLARHAREKSFHLGVLKPSIGNPDGTSEKGNKKPLTRGSA
jgi:hypothetical protein